MAGHHLWRDIIFGGTLSLQDHHLWLDIIFAGSSSLNGHSDMEKLSQISSSFQTIMNEQQND